MVEYRVGDKVKLKYGIFDMPTVNEFKTFTVSAHTREYVFVTHDFGKGNFTFDLGQIELVKRRNKITVNTRKMY